MLIEKGMRRLFWGAVSAWLWGCAGADEAARPLAAPCSYESQEEEQAQAAAPAVADSFWSAEAQDELSRPRPRLRRSISLGYVGDEPLSGGVMRDTPMPPPEAQGGGLTWQQYIRQRSWPEQRPARPYYDPTYLPPYARCPSCSAQ
jgi:hypothetical protein